MKITEEQLKLLQRLANSGEILPPDTGEWKTLQEWYDLLMSYGIHIGMNKLRKTLAKHGSIFKGTECRDDSPPRNQFWYKIDLDLLAAQK